MSEYVLCAAIWWDDGEPYHHQPTATGRVFCGFRHCNIIGQMAGDPAYTPRDCRNQGFLTSEGRYVEREEAQAIARAAGQLDEEKRPTRGSILFSEDLY